MKYIIDCSEPDPDPEISVRSNWRIRNPRCPKSGEESLQWTFWKNWGLAKTKFFQNHTKILLGFCHNKEGGSSVPGWDKIPSISKKFIWKFPEEGKCFYSRSLNCFVISDLCFKCLLSTCTCRTCQIRWTAFSKDNTLWTGW